MKNILDLRSFLSRQKGIPYCPKCLLTLGNLDTTNDSAAQMITLSISEFPTALTAAFEVCGVCKIRCVCVTFPGRVIGSNETNWALALLVSDSFVAAA